MGKYDGRKREQTEWAKHGKRGEEKERKTRRETEQKYLPDWDLVSKPGEVSNKCRNNGTGPCIFW